MDGRRAHRYEGRVRWHRAASAIQFKAYGAPILLRRIQIAAVVGGVACFRMDCVRGKGVWDGGGVGHVVIRPIAGGESPQGPAPSRIGKRVGDGLVLPGNL